VGISSNDRCVTKERRLQKMQKKLLGEIVAVVKRSVTRHDNAVGWLLSRVGGLCMCDRQKEGGVQLRLCRGEGKQPASNSDA